jgi:hypothetical protein
MRVSRLRGPPLTLFAALSVGVHAALFQAVRDPPPPKPLFEASAPVLAGDTLEVEPPSHPVEPDDFDPGAASGAARPLVTRSPIAPNPAVSPPPAAAAGHASRNAPSGAPAAPAALFGAVGVRSAIDLPTSFTRAFPQAASADPIWAQVAYGSAGVAELTLVLDETGRLASSAIGGAPSTALRRGIDRTLSILGARPFTARASVTKLRVVARVSRDDVHDGLHGDVFALSGGSFAGDVGTAFFALPGAGGPGRRVDLELRLLP